MGKKPKSMKRRFKLTMRIRGTDVVLGIRGIEIDLPEDGSTAVAAMRLLQAESDFVRDLVEVVAEETKR